MNETDTNNHPLSCSVQVGDLSFRNPILGASGTFGYGLEFAKVMDLERIGGFVTKGLSMRPRSGNAAPRIHETAYGMLNAIGLHNIGAEAFVKDKLPKLRSIDTQVIANVYGENLQDFVDVSEYLSQHEGIAALEINMSCPNVDKSGLDLGTSPQQIEQLLLAIGKVTNLPLWAKLTPNVTHINDIAEAAINGGAQALSLINSVKATALDWRKNQPHLSNIYGGLSGPAIKPIALAKVNEVASRFDIAILGIGGIANANDVLEFISVGANAVQVGTQNFTQSQSSMHIADELQNLLQSENKQLSDIYRQFHRREGL